MRDRYKSFSKIIKFASTYIYKKNLLIIIIFVFTIFILANNNECFGKEQKTESSNGLKENDTIFFGKYEQDGNLENGPEPIEWIVLGIKENKALLVSKYILDFKEMHPYDEQFNWENSELRDWLNDDFFQKAFSYSEKLKMVRIELSSKSLENRTIVINKDSSSSTTENPFLYKLLGVKNYQPPKSLFGFVVCPDLNDMMVLEKNKKLATYAVPALNTQTQTSLSQEDHSHRSILHDRKRRKGKGNENEKDNNTFSETDTNGKNYEPLGYWLRNMNSIVNGRITKTYFDCIDTKGHKDNSRASFKNGVRPEILIDTDKNPTNPWKKE